MRATAAFVALAWAVAAVAAPPAAPADTGAQAPRPANARLAIVRPLVE